MTKQEKERPLWEDAPDAPLAAAERPLWEDAPDAPTEAAQKVAADRAAKPAWIRTFDDKLQQIAKGAIPWADEIKAFLGPMAGGGEGTYEENLAEEVEKGKAADKDSTVLGKVKIPYVGETEITTGTAAKVGGGIASAFATPAVRVMQGATMIPRIVNSAIPSAIWGAIYGSGEDKENRLRGAGVGAGLGFGMGAATPAVGSAAANTWRAARNAFSPSPGALRQYERGAVSRVGRAFAADDVANTYPRQAAELGPEGMLADMGRNLRLQAGAVYNAPGEGATTVGRAITDRHTGARHRIEAQTDASLGPAANMPETIEATAQHYRAQAQPHRQQFQNNPVPFTPQLENLLEHIRENTPAVLGEARRYANEWSRINGTQPQFFARQNANGGWDIDRIPNATEWDHIKRAFDAMTRGGNASRTDQTIYGDLARTVRDTVDEALSPGAPNQSPWAQARGLERENFQIREAAEAGEKAFERGMTPDELRAEMFGVGPQGRGAMDPPELAGFRLGARQNVRNIMGEAATQHGENASAAARSKLGSLYAREKLGLITERQQQADDLIHRLDAETRFANTRQAVTQNSATAERQAAQAEFPSAVANPITNTTVVGLGHQAARGFANMLFGGLINESRARIAADAARMLVAQGADRDRIVQALMQRAQQRNLPPAQREAILSAANRIMQGAEKPAVDAVTSSDPPPLVHRSKYRDNPDSGYASGISSILEDDARKRKP
jgi:hypothetical protein